MLLFLCFLFLNCKGVSVKHGASDDSYFQTKQCVISLHFDCDIIHPMNVN